MNVMEALRTLAPGAEWSTDGTSITEWFSPDIPQPTQAEIDAEVARLQAEYNSQAYARARAEAYLPIAEQLDLQYWDSVNGTTNWADHIAAVKAMYPAE